jgi:hypothetical protein
MSVIARSPDGTIRLYCKGSDAKVMKKIRADTPPELLDNTNANLHYFAKQVGILGDRGRRTGWQAARGRSGCLVLSCLILVAQAAAALPYPCTPCAHC